MIVFLAGAPVRAMYGEECFRFTGAAPSPRGCKGGLPPYPPRLRQRHPPTLQKVHLEQPAEGVERQLGNRGDGG